MLTNTFIHQFNTFSKHQMNFFRGFCCNSLIICKVFELNAQTAFKEFYIKISSSFVKIDVAPFLFNFVLVPTLTSSTVSSRKKIKFNNILSAKEKRFSSYNHLTRAPCATHIRNVTHHTLYFRKKLLRNSTPL